MYWPQKTYSLGFLYPRMGWPAAEAKGGRSHASLHATAHEHAVLDTSLHPASKLTNTLTLTNTHTVWLTWAGWPLLEVAGKNNDRQRTINDREEKRTCSACSKKTGGGRCRFYSCSALHYSSTGTFENVKAFTTKLMFWKAQLSEKKLIHFPASKVSSGGGHSIQWWKICCCHWEATAGIWPAVCRLPRHTVPLSKCLLTTSPLMCRMSPVCYKWRSLTFSAILSSKPSSERQKEKQTCLDTFWELPPSFPEFSRMFKRTMCLLEAHIWYVKKLFSTVNFNKSKTRSRLSDAHLQAILRVSTATSLRANVARLSEKKRSQVSGSKH